MDIFGERRAPWDGIGFNVEGCTTSKEVLEKTGLDFTVVKRALKDAETNEIIPGIVATVRSDTHKVLGVVSDNRYNIVQNVDGLEFVNRIVGSDAKFVSAGSLNGGRKIWIMVELPERYIFEEAYKPYLVFTNSHDGNSAVRSAVTPIRIACSNTLNLALNKASRSWSCNHRGDLQSNLHEASKTLSLTDKYMKALEMALEEISDISVDEVKAERLISYILPINKEESKRKNDHIKEMREDILFRWREAPDLSESKKDGRRFLNAVSDFAVHTKLHRDTPNFKENLFGKVISGSGLYIDKAYDILRKGS